MARTNTKSKSTTVKRFKTNVNQMKKAATKVREEAANRGGESVDQFKAAVGSNLVRILPPWSEEGFFYKDYWVHFIETTSSEGKPTSRPVLCLEKEHGKKCPACEFRKQLVSSGEESDKELAKKYNRSHRYTMQVVDQNNPDKGILLWSVSAKMMEEILKWFEKDDWGDITDPEEGYDLEFTRTGKGQFDTKYSAPTPATKNPTELEDWEELLEKLMDLDEYVNKMELERKEFEALLEGEELEEEEEEEKPRSKGHSTGSKSRKQPEPEEEDEDEDEEDDEDSDEEAESYTEEELEEFEDDELIEIAEEDFELEVPYKGRGKAKKVDRDKLIAAILEAQDEEEDDEPEDDKDEDEDEESETYSEEELEEFEDDELVEIAEEDFELEIPYKGRGKAKKVDRDKLIEAILEAQGDSDDEEEDEIPFEDEKKGESTIKGKTPAASKGARTETSSMAASLRDKIRKGKK